MGRTGVIELVRSLAERMRTGLRDGVVRRMIVPPRETASDASGAKFISMPAISPDYDLYINKVATIAVPGGAGPTVTSVVPMFSVSTGRFLGVLDGTVVTNLKCAAVTALVTDRCALASGASGGAVLGIIGSGVQARQQYLGVSAVRDLDQVRVFSRNQANAAAFAGEIQASATVGVVVCGSAEQASRGVDILVTATTSADPLPISARLPSHVHINCVGAHTVVSRELSEELLRTSVLIVEDRPTAIAEAGPVHSAALELDVLGTAAADGFAARRTVFSSTGCAYLDLITCAHLADTVHDGEFDAAIGRLGIEVPVDLAGGVLHGYRGLRDMAALLRETQLRDGEALHA